MSFISVWHLSIKLSHGDGLGVEYVGLDRLIERVVFGMPSAMQGLQCVSQDDVHSGLTATGGPDQHDAMTHQHGLIQLDHLRKTTKQEVAGVQPCEGPTDTKHLTRAEGVIYAEIYCIYIYFFLFYECEKI